MNAKSKSLTQLINDNCNWYSINVMIIIRTKCKAYISNIEQVKGAVEEAIY